MATNLTQRAKELGVSLAALLDANRDITDPNKVTAAQLRNVNVPRRAKLGKRETQRQLNRVFATSGQSPGGAAPQVPTLATQGQGLTPSPGESQAAFLQRVRASQGTAFTGTLGLPRIPSSRPSSGTPSAPITFGRGGAVPSATFDPRLSQAGRGTNRAPEPSALGNFFQQVTEGVPNQAAGFGELVKFGERAAASIAFGDPLFPSGAARPSAQTSAPAPTRSFADVVKAGGAEGSRLLSEPARTGPGFNLGVTGSALVTERAIVQDGILPRNATEDIFDILAARSGVASGEELLRQLGYVPNPTTPGAWFLPDASSGQVGGGVGAPTSVSSFRTGGRGRAGGGGFGGGGPALIMWRIG